MKKVLKYISSLKTSKIKAFLRHKKNRPYLAGFLIGIGLILIGFIGLNSYQLYHLNADSGEYLLNKHTPRQSNFTLPIFTYHHLENPENLSDEFEARLSFSPSNFEEELKFLNENGFTTLSSSNLNKIPSKAVWLTIDDGYLDNYTNAFALLKKYNQRATFYIITSKVGEDGYMNWDQIKEIKDAGMEIGCHSKTHPNLTTLNSAQANDQIAGCKKELEEKLNNQIITFAYPASEYNDSVVAQVKEAGFTNAVTTKSAVASQKSDLFKLPRLRINSDTTLAGFKNLAGE